MQIVYILLDEVHYNFEPFIKHFEKKWLLPFEPYRDENSLGLIVDGRVIGCGFFPFPVTESLLIQNARDNILWLEAEERVSRHKAHLRVSMAREGDPVAAHALLSKVVCSLLHQGYVSGVYLAPGLFEPAYYIKCAEGLVKKKQPTELWVHINIRGSYTDESYSFNTVGMKKFGKKEFEITDTKKNFIDDYYNLKELIKRTIEKG